MWRHCPAIVCFCGAVGHTHFDCPTLKKTMAKEKYLQNKTKMFNKAIFSARETMSQVL